MWGTVYCTPEFSLFTRLCALRGPPPCPCRLPHAPPHPTPMLLQREQVLEATVLSCNPYMVRSGADVTHVVAHTHTHTHTHAHSHWSHTHTLLLPDVTMVMQCRSFTPGVGTWQRSPWELRPCLSDIPKQPIGTRWVLPHLLPLLQSTTPGP